MHSPLHIIDVHESDLNNTRKTAFCPGQQQPPPARDGGCSHSPAPQGNKTL